MADISLARVASMGDFLTDEVYDVQFVTIPDGFSGISAEDINLRCSSIEIPDTPVEYMSVTHRTFTKQQPVKRNNNQSISLSMVETTSVKTLPFLRDWMNRCALKGTNFVYPPSQRQCEILIYHKCNDKSTAWVYNCKNVQVETKGNRSLGNGDSVSTVIAQITLNTSLILEGPNVNELA